MQIQSRVYIDNVPPQVGLYIKSKLKKIIPKSNFGLYRDGGLALLRNLNAQQTDKVSKNIIKAFQDIRLALRLKLISKKQIL